jgi:hypothetical protein
MIATLTSLRSIAIRQRRRLIRRPSPLTLVTSRDFGTLPPRCNRKTSRRWRPVGCSMFCLSEYPRRLPRTYYLLLRLGGRRSTRPPRSSLRPEMYWLRSARYSTEFFCGLAFEVLETRDRLMLHYEFSDNWREIWTGEKFPPAATPQYMGYSVGRWEGNTFVVDSAAYKISFSLGEVSR